MAGEPADASRAFEYAEPDEWDEPGTVSHCHEQSIEIELTKGRLDYYKHQQGLQPTPVELHSPEPGQQEFRAELADNAQKPPRT